jgi:hypothetical protein
MIFFARYLRTSPTGHGHYRTFVDGKLYGEGGLSTHINGQRVEWKLIPHTPNYSGVPVPT